MTLHPETDIEYWDQAAIDFDKEPDHGLADPAVRQAWEALLSPYLPKKRSVNLDIGCGTGSLSILIASLGHCVIGIDFSPTMIAIAATKTARTGFPIEFCMIDATNPSFEKATFDVVVGRHVLWQFTSRKALIDSWIRLLTDRGSLILVEGFWEIGAGIQLSDTLNYLPIQSEVVAAQNLSENTALWGRKVPDERYIVVARRCSK